MDLIPLEEETDTQDTVLDSDILQLPCVQFWQKTYVQSLIPFIIMNKKLQIIWENDIYITDLNHGQDRLGEYLTSLYAPFTGEETMNQLYNSITTSSLGYSWRGRLESGGKKERKVIANTMIFPIYSQNSDDINPVGYAAVFDNITKEYRDMQRTTFSSLLEASKLKDNDTGQHIQRVNEYSQTIAKALYKNSKYDQVDMQFVDDIGFLAAMHDVGKIGTPDDILNKTGPLDGREWEIMKEHTINGAYILSTYANPMAKEIALFHHEHWDGNGYPYLLSEAMIPLSARIVALADVYDALRMQRSYKTSYNHEKAYSIILDSEGNHFDPQLTAVFKKNETDFADIYEKLAD